MTVLAILRLELVGALRRRSTLLALAIAMLPALAATILNVSQMVSVPRGSRAGFYLTLLLLAAPVAGSLVGAGVLARRRRLRFDVVWARGIQPTLLTAATCAPGLLLVTLGVLLSVGIFKVLSPDEPASIGALYAMMAPAALPAYWISVAAAVVLGVLVGETPTILVVSALTLALGTLPPQSLAFPTNVLGLGFYWDESAGFGPDAHLILARATWGAALAVALLLIGPLALVTLDRRGAPGGHSLFSTGLVALFAPALAVPGYLVFAQAAQSTIAVPPWPTGEPGVALRTEKLQLNVDCARQILSGTSRLRVDGAASPLHLALNPGLQVTNIAASSITAWRQEASGVIVIDSVSAGTTIDIQYRGALIFHRDDYAPALPGLAPASAVRLPIRAYLSSEVCFLMRGGDWYPRGLGLADGPDGSFIDELELHADDTGVIVVPAGSSRDIALQSPTSCLFVSLERPATTPGRVAPTTAAPGSQEPWSQISARLSQMRAFTRPIRAVLLPLIDEVLPSPDGFCAPLAAGTIRGPSQLVERAVGEQAARLWIDLALVLDQKQGIRSVGGSTQERYPRAMPQPSPAFVVAFQSAIADLFESDLVALLDLRLRAQADPKLQETLGRRGVLGGPAINDAVLALHEYRKVSGDHYLGRLLGLVAEAAQDTTPSSVSLASAVSRLSADQQATLKALLQLR